MNSKNLITEINIMRSMMGLKEKNMLITESGLIGLVKAFGKTAARHTDDVTKIFDDFLATSAGGSGSLAGANRLKGLLDNLDSAVKIGDDAAITTVMKNILNDADFGAAAATKVADDMFADTADDAITAVLNKRANALKGRGLTDDAIKAQIKSDIDALLGEFPDTLKTAAKSKADNVINWGGKGQKITKVNLEDDVFEKLAQSPVWRDVQAGFPDLFTKLKNRVKAMAAAGSKTSDEIVERIIKQAEDGMKPGFKKWWNGWKADNPNLFKYGTRSIGVLVLLGIIEEAAGDVGLLKQLGAKVCQLAGGKDVSFLWCDDWVEAVKAAEDDDKNPDNTNKEENTTTGKCDQTLDSFKAYLTSQNFSADNATFDTNTCTGAVDGIGFTYDTTLKTWK